MNCLNCGSETTNKKFCSRSCACSYNNRLKPKRQGSYTLHTCKRCGCLLKKSSYRDNRVVCSDCKPTLADDYKNLTIEDYQERLSVKGKHPSWVNAHIRNFARSWNKHLTKLPCAKCGYSKHVEICHIRPLSSFSKEATLGEVNALTNVVQLCPNCHWEFDNGLIN